MSMPKNYTENENCQIVCSCAENQTRAYSNFCTTLVHSVTPVIGGLVLLIVFVLLTIIPHKLRSKHNKHFEAVLLYILMLLIRL